MKKKEIKARLEYLRGEIEAERISYGEISELQALTEHIAPDDVQLLEWAGVPENPFDRITWMKLKKTTSPAKGGIYIARRLINMEQPAWYLAVNEGVVPNGQRCFWDEQQFNEHFEILEQSTDPSKAGTGTPSK